MTANSSEVIAAIIAGLSAIVAAIIGIFNHRKLQEIHILVNSRLDQALAEITDLKEQRDIKQAKE